MDYEILLRILITYGGVAAIASMILWFGVITTRGDLAKPFTPYQVMFGPLIWPWYLVKGMIWWFKMTYEIITDLARIIRTNKWKDE